MRIRSLFLILLLALPLTSFAHSGSKDSSGGDYCWTNCESYGLHTGEYHYHDENDNAIFTYDNNPDLYELNTAKRLRGNILLQVEERGEAWYVRSSDSKRYYMKDGDVAYEMMRFFSLGITDDDLAHIPTVQDTTQMNSSASVCSTNSFASSLSGEILLQVQQHGEAWYVDPAKCLRIYLKDGSAAYESMRYLGLGITNKDLEKVVVGSWQTDDEEEVIKENEQIVIEEKMVVEEEKLLEDETQDEIDEQNNSAVSSETISQKNAVKLAKSYLDYSGFSHDRLVAQLEYEQFSYADAVYGVDNSGANWNEQAARVAQSYMEYSAFSRGSLIEQLKYEKFTQEQAEYGADAVGL